MRSSNNAGDGPAGVEREGVSRKSQSSTNVLRGAAFPASELLGRGFQNLARIIFCVIN